MQTRSDDPAACTPAALKRSTLMLYGAAWFIATCLSTWALVIAGMTA
jgi:hypothetical protein